MYMRRAIKCCKRRKVRGVKNQHTFCRNLQREKKKTHPAISYKSSDKKAVFGEIPLPPKKVKGMGTRGASQKGEDATTPIFKRWKEIQQRGRKPTMGAEIDLSFFVRESQVSI